MDLGQHSAALRDHGCFEPFCVFHNEGIFCQKMRQPFGGIRGALHQQSRQPLRQCKGGGYRFSGPQALRPDRGVGVVVGHGMDVAERDPAAARGMAGDIQRAGP